MVQLTQELIPSLDALAARRAISRSALIREFVVDGLAQRSAAAIGERIADGIAGPQAEPDEWGDLAADLDAANDDLLARLDAEERRRDTGPGEAW